MQTKTISAVIKAKVKDWIESVNDTQLRLDLEKHILVSGGSITSLYLNEEVNDYDIYLTDRATLVSLVNYYIKGHENALEVLDGTNKNALIDKYRGEFSTDEFLKHQSHRACALRTLKPEQIKIYVNNGGGYKVELPELKDGESPKKYQPSFFSPNAISLTDDIQIVIRFWGTNEEIHKTFDFIHATNYFTFNTGVVINTEALESLLTKTLRYQGSLYPVTSIIRAKKFIKRGFNIGAGELLKIMFQISLLDLTDMDTLEEQLIGVDVAYFGMLIEALRKHQENAPDFKLTPKYFNQLIDSIFNDTNYGD